MVEPELESPDYIESGMAISKLTASPRTVQIPAEFRKEAADKIFKKTYLLNLSYTYKTCWKCCNNNERPTGKKHTNVGWDDDGK